MKSPYDIIDTLLITEKSSDMQGDNQYCFKVHKSANKIEIKKAVEALFNDVKVKSVNTINVSGKPKRVGRMRQMGNRSDWKKAIVTLKHGKIDYI